MKIGRIGGKELGEVKRDSLRRMLLIRYKKFCEVKKLSERDKEIVIEFCKWLLGE